MQYRDRREFRIGVQPKSLSDFADVLRVDPGRVEFTVKPVGGCLDANTSPPHRRGRLAHAVVVGQVRQPLRMSHRWAGPVTLAAGSKRYRAERTRQAGAGLAGAAGCPGSSRWKIARRANQIRIMIPAGRRYSSARWVPTKE